MSRKRWIALGIAVILFIFSIGFQFITSMAFGTFTNFESGIFNKEEEFTENIIQAGDPSRKIVVLEVNGVIQDTGDVRSIFESPTYNHRQFLRMLSYAGKDPSVIGIILRVNSPGGGVVESAEVHHYIKRIQEQFDKKVYVSMGSIAASGGYYISAPADKIFASPETLTGSLGVIIQSWNVSELAERYGVKMDTVKSGEYKDILSPTKALTNDEKNILQEMVNNSYESFVSVIVEGRGIPRGTVLNLADGRIYDGRQAKENGLIDDFGYFDEVVEEMKVDLNMEEASIVGYQQNYGVQSFLQLSSNQFFQKEVNVVELLSQPNAPRPMYLYSK